jgi:superfamily II DNA/RNA helicase
MAFAKFRQELAELLADRGYNEPNEFQGRIVDAIKSGKNLMVESPVDAGKTTSILFSVLQRITEPGEGSPRAIIICADDQRARLLYAEFEKMCRPLDLTVDLAVEKGNMLQQRNDLFDGTEIIVGTPKRIHDLYIQNGFNVSKLKMFIIDDALEIMKANHKMRLSRLADSLPKCQHILYSSSFSDSRIEEYMEEFIPVINHLTFE